MTHEKQKVNQEKKPRYFQSIRLRTGITFLVFSVVLLLMLWAVFLVFLTAIYGPYIKSEFQKTSATVIAATPRQFNENTVDAYKTFISGFAQRDSVAFVVLADNDGQYDAMFTVDAFGAVTDGPAAIGSVINDVDIAAICDGHAAVSVGTTGGTYLFYGENRSVTIGGVDADIVVLAATPFELYNTQTTILLIALISCTVIVLVISCLMSVLFSRHQTRLLTDFSKNAKRLADGDFSVEFTGGGFEEYENLASALNTAKDEIQKTEAMRTDVVANVSHDIRTPLTMIRGYAEVLRDMPVDAEKRERTAEIIISETERLTALTDDILNLSRLQAGVAEFKYRTCDVAEITRRALDGFEIFCERDGVRFVTDIVEKAEAVCDEIKLKQLIYNFVINAINYRGDDNIVVVTVKDGEHAVRVEVGDHGKGIAPEEIDDVWERYYRSAHTKRSSVGTGLGLCICKNILIAHGAEYGVDSDLGKGSTFWFELKKDGRAAE